MKLLGLVLCAMMIAYSPMWPLGDNPSVGDPFIIVQKSRHQLTFVNQNHVVFQAPVATGKTAALTPEGLFTVTVKAVQPYYRRKNIPGGAPNNPLGSRWIGFDAKETDGRLFGIHGTNQPDSIGQNVSAGCIRMDRDNLERLYEDVPIGTKILITNKKQSPQALAKAYGAIGNN
ncbi:transpeptidase [Pullulanibacillus camelliae]|uniref:Transpeptidase n=1 Tax=Pullulanibacillus camelliae TaxID=1707096 RepID=A0A8J2VRG2_9BACL|nr:L,D-transpeptidase [Pullulanibacillus camelliae]GGE37743.1 transpeptidase [Pullulanibacillus camelliae]